jgi:signal transduction histidine kinase/FixJ family two-component response regulator
MRRMNQQTVLLVDDEEDIRLVLGIALADMGYKVLSAENGKEGLRLFREERPPIVITDIKMPDIDGVDLLRTIKEEDPDTEVVMITGHGDMDVAIQSFQQEATDFITKPINVENLEHSLQRVHERILAREKLREYTHSLETMVHRKSKELASLEKALQGGDGGPVAGDVVRRFQRLFDDLPCHVVVMDEELVLTAVNRKFRRDFGDREGELCYHVLKGVETPCTDCAVQATFGSGESQEGEAEITTPDGANHQVLVWTSPVRTAGEAPTHVLTLYTDMAQIQKVQDHLSSLGLMVGSISHSIKGMLTGLDGGMYMLDSGLRKRDDDQVHEGLGVVKEMVGRIRNMVLDVLLFSKDRDLQRVETGVAEFASETAKGIRSLVEEHGIEFSMDCPENAGVFEVDAGLLRTAFVNVLENAVDACLDDREREDHRISFRVRGGEDEVVFEVEDDGVGMDEETRDKMATLFFSSKDRKGTGLGLYITDRTVRQHGGDIAVDSEPGRGTVFTIRVPRKADGGSQVVPPDGSGERGEEP